MIYAVRRMQATRRSR